MCVPASGASLIGKQLLPQDRKRCQVASGVSGQCAIITDSNVAPLLADRGQRNSDVSAISPDADHNSGRREIEDTSASGRDL
jgi:hypothetical protein